MQPGNSQDARDGRPLAYTGRLVLPNPAVLQNGNEAIPWVFKDSALYRNRRNTVEAKQLPSRSMVAMESLDPTSLPSVDGSYVHGAQKYVQIGGDAAERLLESLVVSLLALAGLLWLVMILVVPFFFKELVLNYF